jgi:uncharacterized protein
LSASQAQVSHSSMNSSEHQVFILKQRQAKDSLFRLEQSPLDTVQKQQFAGLTYFTVAHSWRVLAKVYKIKKGKSFKMPTNTSRVDWYKKYAKLVFTIDGKEYQLIAYQNLDNIRHPEYKKYLFVPFRDKTSGSESYGGGRYLDLIIPNDEFIWLDFNLAYNPYCAYNYNYSCPIPPKENTLSIAIEAGEKSFVMK